MPERILVTGCAGFIGFHCARRLARDGHEVVGIDNLNDYYDVRLKHARLAELAKEPTFRFLRLDIADEAALSAAVAAQRPARVLHLAAQAGVRHSIDRPREYLQANIIGFFNLLEACRVHRPAHLVFASSSSVYGANLDSPFAETHDTDRPESFYAATKKANEAMAHAYSRLHGLAMTGLRFFTVYGPWGRPDMAYYSFTRKILAGETLDIFNAGAMQRDFTYIDDVTEGVVRVLAAPPRPQAGGPPPCRIYNIGNHTPVRLMEFVETLESLLGRKALKRMLPMQPGDVPVTAADVTALVADHGFAPNTPLRVGLENFVRWYRGYYAEEAGDTGAR